MEGRSGANAVRARTAAVFMISGTAHAVTLCADLLVAIDLLLCVEERDVGDRVALSGTGRSAVQ
jgi:hypothetical protein